jgi:hypothetical protein
MFHGTSDNIVNIEQSQELYDSLKNHNVVTEFVKVSGGSHGGDKMNSTENLNKAVAFLDKAREAKTTVKKDSTVGLVPKFAKSFGMEIRGNLLTVRGDMGSFRYTVVSVNGERKASGFFRKELDLSHLPVGVYGIVVEAPSGTSNFIKFAKK